jgi:hypothetical protein
METMVENKDFGVRQKLDSAASATKVPTVNSIQNMKRFSSYSALLEENSEATSTISPAGVKTNNGDQDTRSSENMVKAALTEFLNDGEVKNNPDGNRCVQNLLMKTEREWRKQRRNSAQERAHE